MKVAKLLSAFMVLFVNLPIWFFLLHTLLVAAKVDRLCFFLFWIYVPIGFLATAISQIGDMK
jgi:hypothetical protein